MKTNKYTPIRGFYNPQHIVAREKPDLVAQMKAFDKRMEAISEKVHEIVDPVAKVISRICRAYFRFVLFCGICVVLYAMLFNAVESNPAIIENVPAIATILETAEALVAKASEFLNWNLNWLNDAFEHLAEELAATNHPLA